LAAQQRRGQAGRLVTCYSTDAAEAAAVQPLAAAAAAAEGRCRDQQQVDHQHAASLLLALHHHCPVLLLLLLLLLLLAHWREWRRLQVLVLLAVPDAADVQVLLHPAATAAGLQCLLPTQSQTHPPAAAAAAAGLWQCQHPAAVHLHQLRLLHCRLLAYCQLLLVHRCQHQHQLLLLAAYVDHSRPAPLRLLLHRPRSAPCLPH
jgi:hypothetical protein